MIVVSDTSPIINLAAVSHLNLLQALFTEIVIPESVYREIVIGGAGRPGAHEVQTSGWFKVGRVTDLALLKILEIHLDSGEAETIALGAELNSDLLLLDERRARRIAARLGLRYIGLLGVLIDAKLRGHLPKVKPVLDALVGQAGFWLSSDLYTRVIQAAGE